jgi:hypothetical protein
MDKYGQRYHDRTDCEICQHHPRRLYAWSIRRVDLPVSIGTGKTLYDRAAVTDPPTRCVRSRLAKNEASRSARPCSPQVSQRIVSSRYRSTCRRCTFQLNTLESVAPQKELSPRRPLGLRGCSSQRLQGNQAMLRPSYHFGLWKCV